MKRISGKASRSVRGSISLLWIVLAVSALLLAGCSSRAGAAQSGGAPTATPAEQSAYPGSKIVAEPSSGPVGTHVTISGTGFPANSPVALTWKTVDGTFDLEQQEVVFVGPRYSERDVSLPAVSSDASGALKLSFDAPEDFGGSHDVTAQVDGKFATKLGFTITPTFRVTATSGPIGTQFELVGTGLGSRAQESMYEVSWDDGFTGYMMGVTTHGTATARLRMAGPAGQHVLKVWRNYRGIPYLNPQQGPFGKLVEPNTWLINVTDGPAAQQDIWADPAPQDTVRATPDVNDLGGASLTVSPDKGTVGSTITVRGAGFPANQPVKLTWATRTGQKITATGLLEGFDEQLRDLPAATAGPDGGFTVAVPVPDDYAGYHRISAASGNGSASAEAYFSIYSSVVQFTDTAKVGSDVVIHLKGVGWTIQGKTYAITYDNAYLGYACSFSTKGDIEVHLPAAGGPGLHVIDLYPAVYEGQDPTPNIYSRPNLTYVENHPGGPLPAFHLTLAVAP